jgi:hypothetical protein
VGFRTVFVSFFLFGFLFATDNVRAQTVAYRQTNLASNLPNVANNVTPRLVTATAVAAIVAVGLAIAGCGGYGGNAQANRGTASIMVTAQSGNNSHMTTIRVTAQ